MSKIAPVHYYKLVQVFEKLGFALDRTEGDHLIYVKKDALRPIVIPKYRAVPVFIIKNNLKSAGITREVYLSLLKNR